ncbi:uncharacterized protein [Diadema antillarum]|uniref:uncharacterized protein n=1 Tax=Diadema antillarum TaxID=105358 RepID=UPI003A8BC97F
MLTVPEETTMNSLDSEPPYSGLGSGGCSTLPYQSRSQMGEYMKGGADPLLSQDPHSVHPTYSSMTENEASSDFPEETLMPSSSLYGLYLLQPSADSSPLPKVESSLPSASAADGEQKGANGRASDSEENIDVLTLDNHTQQSPDTNGLNHDALFEGMPFYELKGREVGPCAYCTMWRAIRFLSYCGNYPFCSVQCTKKFAVYKREKGELLEKTSGDLNTSLNNIKVPTLFEEHKPQPLFPPRRDLFLNAKHSTSVNVNGVANGHMTNGHSQQFDWSLYLQEHDTEAAPTRCFCHAPLSQEWKGNMTGAMIEVHNRDPDESADSFWVARVIQMAGYKARLRFEGYGMDSSQDFSIHLLMAECYPVNGAVKMGRVMKPPKGVLARLGSNWQEHLARVAHSGSPTIPLPKNKDYLQCKFKKGMQLEAVYKRQISHTIVGTVIETVANRIHVQYENCKDPSKDFWFQETSPWIHPVGWSQRVGHLIIATAAYKSEALDKGRNKKGGPEDAPWEIFKMPPSHEDTQFRVGMKLEVVDPLHLDTICVATVMEVLREGFLMLAVDGCVEDSSSWFCCHDTSPTLLPVGFCEYHKIDLQPPQGYENHFDWVDYLRITESVAAPIEIFHQKTIDRGFKVGHKLEAVDLIEPGFICVTTVTKVAGPLLRVHFDGWDRSYDQWMDCDSPDIYPVGWCEMVSYPLQPPRIHESQDYISITPVCKPSSRRKHYATGEKRRMALGPALERMHKMHAGDKKLLPSVYSFSDEENSQEGGAIPPPPKKQLTKKVQNTSALKLKTSRPNPKHNGKGRPKDASTHHNYALPSSREGSIARAASESQDQIVDVTGTVSAEPNVGVKVADFVNGIVDHKTTEKGEFIVEVEKGVVNCVSKADASLSSLDSPPLSADSSSGSVGVSGSSQQGAPDAGSGKPSEPGKFTMKNWSHVEHKQCNKILSSRPFKDFGREKGGEFGMETYNFEDASSAPPVTIPKASKQDKKKKKKKKKNKKRKEREKDKEVKEKHKEKHKKDSSSSKKKKKSDKERKKERRKEKARAKAKASQLSTLLNLPTVMQTDDVSTENVLNHILNDKKTHQEGLHPERVSKVKFSMNNVSKPATVSSAPTVPSAVSAAEHSSTSKLPTLDRLLTKSSSEETPVSVTPLANIRRTLTADLTAFATKSVSSDKSYKVLDTVTKEQSVSSSSGAMVGSSFVAAKESSKQHSPRPKLKEVTPRDRLVKDDSGDADDPYRFEVEPSENPPSKLTKDKGSKPPLKKESSKQGSSCKSEQVTAPSSAASKLASQAQVQKVIKDVNTSLTSQHQSSTLPTTKERAQMKKKEAAVGAAPRINQAPALSPEDAAKLRQIQSFLMQDKISDILAKQQMQRKGQLSSEEASALGAISPQGLANPHVGLINALGSSPAVSLPSPQPGMPRMLSSADALVQSLIQQASVANSSPRPPPPPHPASLPLHSDLQGSTQPSPTHPSLFPGFRPPSNRDLCNMVALSRPPKEFCMPVNVRSPSPTSMLQTHINPPQMSPTSLPGSSPTGLSPTVSRPPPTYGAHLTQAMRGIPRSPMEPRAEFLPFPPQALEASYGHSAAPQRLPPLQSLLVQQRYPPPPPHPKRASMQGIHTLGSIVSPTHPLSLQPPPPPVPPPPYNLHQAMANQRSPLPSPIGRQGHSSSASSPQTSPATPGEPMPAPEQPATPSGGQSQTEKMINPWTWGILEVVQFLQETGEGSCADCFRRQNIDGQKLMSLTKEQIVKLTGMKVAPSLKIYEQIVKLRLRFPTPPPASSPKTESVAR